MSKDNRAVRENLERIYGKGCWFARAKLAERLEQVDGVLSYKKYVQKQHYSKKKLHKLNNNMTLHHLVHQSEGGATSLENGAVVSELAHRYLHNGLSREQEEIANNMLRDFKNNRNYSHYTKAKITLVNEDEIVIPYEIKTAEISFTEELQPNVNTSVLDGMTDEELEFYKKHKQKRNERVYEKFNSNSKQEVNNYER
jgi:hypothetical protein